MINDGIHPTSGGSGPNKGVARNAGVTGEIIEDVDTTTTTTITTNTLTINGSNNSPLHRRGRYQHPGLLTVWASSEGRK